MEDPVYVMATAIEPKVREDADRLRTALLRLGAVFSWDPESGQIILRSTSEADLESLCDRLRHEFGADFATGAPQAAYLETIQQAAEFDCSHKRILDGGGEYARVKLRIEPLKRGEGATFVAEVSGGGVPDRFVPAIERGARDALEHGPVAGFPVVDLKIVLVGGAYHDVDSNERSFQIAGRRAMREGFVRAAPVLLEPVMIVQVATPEKYFAIVGDDLRARRGRILSADRRTENMLYTARVPMANLFGYANALAAVTDGQGTWSMQFGGYEPAPPIAGPDPTFPAAARVA